MANIKEDLKSLILNYDKPVVFKNVLEWNLLSWNLEQWNDIIGTELLKFRIGQQKLTNKPQWENTCEYRQGTFSEFLHYVEENPDMFAYCDYKHLVENFQNVKELQNGVSWESFGFPDHTAQKSTIWIGSKGAHTPCHKDTYGCNLVAQVYGSKRWILFPPDENLYPTRVPYEESSIFSKLNFYTPNSKKFKDVNKCRTIILRPRDVLLIPPNWWHYVENLETSISINVWLEREDDIVKQFDESLIQFIVGRIFNEIDETQKKLIINPSVDMALFADQVNLNTSLNIVNLCKSNYLKRQSLQDSIATNTIFNGNELLQRYDKVIQIIPELTRSEFENLLSAQLNRFVPTNHSEEEHEEDTLCQLINALTNEDVIKLIKNNLLHSHNSLQ